MSARALILIIFLSIFRLSAARDADSLFIQAETYRYHPGDSALWSEPKFDDSDWGEYGKGAFPNKLWQGIGWFRQQIEIDSSLWGTAFGISVTQAGAIEIYMDGDLIYKRGKVSVNPDEERPYFIESINPPKQFFFPPKPDADSGRISYVLAVRYSAHILNRDLFGYADPRLAVQIDEYSNLETNYLKLEKKATNHQMFLSGFFLALALLHTMFFLFYPKFKANGLFAVLALCAAVMNFLRFDQQFSINVERFILNMTFFQVLTIIMIWTMLYLIYFLNYEKSPRRFKVYTSIYTILAISAFIWPLYLGQTISILIIAAFIDTIYTMIHSFYHKKIHRFEGGWIILISFIPILISGIYLSFIDIGLLKAQFSFIDFPISYYSMLLLFIGFSVFLSYNFSGLNKNLLYQIDEVKRLSEKTLQQELEKAHLESENLRKSRELEEARKLQLSMLPEKMPQLPDLEIAVYMKTATEVGGDYYDYIRSDDNIIIAFGDAAGHGLQAGIMVTAVKSLFKSLNNSADPSKALSLISHALKGMGFGRLFMALTIARYADDELRLSAAGMPYPLLYKRDTDKADFLEINGIPLGQISKVEYNELSINLNPGDHLLFVSDGYTEMFNEKGEMIGEDRLQEQIQLIGYNTPKEIINKLLTYARDWAGSTEQHDDMTLMVIQRK